MKLSSRYYQAGIDLGSSKICCWLGHVQEGQFNIIGTGHIATQGIWGGQITHAHALERALTSSLYEAESQAKVQVRRAIVTLNGSFFVPDYCVASVNLEHRTVIEADLQALWEKIVRPDFHPIHIIPLEFQVDQQEKIIDPRGMVGSSLKGKFLVLWMNTGRLQTLLSCFKRCQIQVSDILFSAYSSALACLSQDEQELGATLVDIGASSTSLSFFLNQKMVGAATIPIGGYHITQDVARGCETQLVHAERLKILYGAALATSHDYYETVSLMPLGEQEDGSSSHIPRSFLMSIIQARCEEIFTSLKKTMALSPYRTACHRVILTGGASQLPGLRELAQRILDCPVRIAKPSGLHKIPSSSNEFSAVSGSFLHSGLPNKNLFGPNNKLQLLLSWLKKKVIT